MKKLLKYLFNWTEVLRRRAICMQCKQFTKNNIKILGAHGKFYSCGKYLSPVSGVSCGCDIGLKTIVSALLRGNAVNCPQNKWENSQKKNAQSTKD